MYKIPGLPVPGLAVISFNILSCKILTFHQISARKMWWACWTIIIKCNLPAGCYRDMEVGESIAPDKALFLSVKGWYFLISGQKHLTEALLMSTLKSTSEYD